MKSLAITTGGTNIGYGVGGGASPILQGRNATIINMTAGSIAVTQSDDNTTYTALVTVPTLSCADVTLPRYIKAASAGLFILGDN